MRIGFWQMAAYTVVIMLIGVSMGFFATKIEKTRQAQPQTVVLESGNNVLTYLPAVDEDGNGVIGTLATSVKPGTGLVLVDVNNVLAQFDTQLSGRTAAQAAANYTGLDLSRYDIVYKIRVNASVIEGPSAGAAMAVSIVAALQNRTLISTTMITGTIEGDGSIGNVGGISEKAMAAKEAGATRFLVPKGQADERKIKRERQCTNVDSVRYCEIKYVTQKVNVGEAIGVELIEVASIGDALSHFI